MSDAEEGDIPPPSRRRIWAKRIGFALAAIFLALTFVNASWLAPEPRGSVLLIAHRGVYQNYDHADLDETSCTATRIEEPVHPYLENTLPSLRKAKAAHAAMVELDIAPTRDGRIVAFHDWSVDCRTDGHGDTRSLTLAELKALDAGYGYTADGGKTFPFRGSGVGLIPALEEYIAEAGSKPLIYNFKSRDPAEADALAAALKAAGRDVEGIGDAFYGGPEEGPVARIREIYPKAWVFSRDAARACTEAYAMQGWFGIVPDECKGGTLVVPLDFQWAMPGWPNRTIARMEAANARILMVGPQGGGGRPMGLNLPEQLGEIPASFNGFVWVEDIWTIAPALYPSRDRRTVQEINRALDGLERRRARQ
ncbi:MAG TPA: glycerophosphodiester phosphodiesterase family protein [Sphingomonadaceae bacterium]|nr:glycerophosphodiester phosphodiesterase family protein [Sphingomonadaceae bacterium]